MNQPAYILDYATCSRTWATLCIYDQISCFWGSRCGHGGPTLSARQTRRLADLELELWFDVYFEGDEDPAPTPANERDGGISAAEQQR